MAAAHRLIDVTERVFENIALGNVMNLLMELSESVFAFISAVFVDKQMVHIEVTIPPGGELRINSENFTVLLGNEDIIHLHSGDWINIDKNTMELTVTSGSGNEAVIDGKLLYTERYL